MDAVTILSGCIATIGAFFLSLIGGWSPLVEALCLFILLDVTTGLVQTCYFGKSRKTASGKFSSTVMYRGILRKGMIFLVLIIGARFDLVFGTEYILEAVMLFYLVQESLSVCENLSACGLPMPQVLKKILDVLDERKNN